MTLARNKFHDYTLGKNVTVESDHKPLEIIIKKSHFDSSNAITTNDITVTAI